MEIGKKKVHVVWNDPIKRDFFTKGTQPLLLSKYVCMGFL